MPPCRDRSTSKRRRVGEAVIHWFLFACGAMSVLTTAGIIYVLGQEAWLFFSAPECPW